MKSHQAFKLYLLGAIAFPAFAVAQTNPAPASNAQSFSIEEVVVTAQRREQRLQDVPLAVSAFTAESLQSGKVESLVNLDGRIPNVVLAPVGAFQFASAFSIRGLGFADVESSFEPTVGVEIDGVYLTRNSGAITDFFDVENVTVLRGPQGTLYGRNTIGGVVSVRTSRPDGEFGVRGQATLGSYDRRELRGAIEGSLIKDVLAAKISGLGKHYDGFQRNSDGRRFGKVNLKSGRGTFVLTPSDNFDATLIVDHTRDRSTGPALSNASLPHMVLAQMGQPADADGDPYQTHVDANLFANLDSTGVTLEMNWDAGAFTLTSISGFRDTKTDTLTDFDGTQIPFFVSHRYETHDQLSQELRIASNGSAHAFAISAAPS